MTEEIPVPTDIVSPFDEKWNNMVEFLQKEDYIEDNERVQVMTVEVEAGDVVVVRDIETVEVPTDGS